MIDRFDLEQDIIKAWGILDDLKVAKSMEEVEAIRNYYDIKFDRLWDTFESVVANYNFSEKIDPRSNQFQLLALICWSDYNNVCLIDLE